MISKLFDNIAQPNIQTDPFQSQVTKIDAPDPYKAATIKKANAPSYTAAQYNPAGYDAATFKAGSRGSSGYDATTYEAGSRGSGGYSADTMNAFMGEVTPEALVEKRMLGLLDQNNDYMRNANTKGLQYANQRGLINSSIAAGAARQAALEAALPIAQQDANSFFQQGRANQDAENAARTANMNAINEARRTTAQFADNAASDNLAALMQARSDNANAVNSARQFTAGAANDASRDNLAALMQARSANAAAKNDASRFSADAANRAGEFNATAANRANEYNQSMLFDTMSRNQDALNRAREFNTQMEADFQSAYANTAYNEQFAKIDAQLQQSLKAVEQRYALELEDLKQTYEVAKNLDTVVGDVYRQNADALSKILSNPSIKGDSLNDRVEMIMANTRSSLEFLTGIGEGTVPMDSGAPAASTPAPTAPTEPAAPTNDGFFNGGLFDPTQDEWY